MSDMTAQLALEDAARRMDRNERLWQAVLATSHGICADNRFAYGHNWERIVALREAAFKYAEELVAEFEKRTAPPATPPHRDQEIERNAATGGGA